MGKGYMTVQKKPRGMKQLYALGKKRSIDLSLSENPLGCSPLVLRALKTLTMVTNDYPQPNGGVLKTALAKKFLLNPRNFFVSNGSGNIVVALAHCFAGKNTSVVIPQLTFPMFRISAENTGAQIITVPMRKDLSIDILAMKKAVRTDTRLVFLCNPNNPTGGLISRNDILSMLVDLPTKALLVVDEANIEFGGTSVIKDVKNNSQLVVLRTFSKGFGLANLRVGFATASTNVIQKLEEETDIFPVSGMSEILATISLKDTSFVAKSKQVVREQRLFLVKELQKLGFTIFPSEANNMFVKIPLTVSPGAFKTTLAEFDISVVSGSNFKGFDDRFFRLSVRLPRVNKQFISAMKELVETAFKNT